MGKYFPWLVGAAVVAILAALLFVAPIDGDSVNTDTATSTATTTEA